MTKHCIETINLTHKFSNDEVALNAVNLQVIENSIYGFLGPNGSGKTTTLKLILGLLKKQHGEITVFGKSFEKNRTDTLKNIGSMIERRRFSIWIFCLEISIISLIVCRF